MRCINSLLSDGDTTISTSINELFWRDIMRLDSETQSTRQVRSTVLSYSWKTTIYPFGGSPIFRGKKLTGFVSGRGNPSDAVRMAWLVVLVPSRCTEPLRRGARRPTDDPPGNDQIFPPTSQMGKLGKSSTSQSAEKKGDMDGYPGGYEHSIFVAVPTCHLLNDVAFCWFGWDFLLTSKGPYNWNKSLWESSTRTLSRWAFKFQRLVISPS